MAREQLICRCCGVALAGDLDTYGLPGQEVCQACWFRQGQALAVPPDDRLSWRELLGPGHKALADELDYAEAEDEADWADWDEDWDDE